MSVPLFKGLKSLAGNYVTDLIANVVKYWLQNKNSLGFIYKLVIA